MLQMLSVSDEKIVYFPLLKTQAFFIGGLFSVVILAQM
jgi:hypothetical protein